MQTRVKFARPRMMNQLAETPLLHNLTVKNILSFGPEGISLDLNGQPLTVLIGPNGSGKSSSEDSIELLKSAPTQLAGPIRNGGGIRNWIWGRKSGTIASVEATVGNPHGIQPLRHKIEFTESAQTFRLTDERRFENEHPDIGHEDPFFFYRFQGGHPALDRSKAITIADRCNERTSPLMSLYSRSEKTPISSRNWLI